MAQKRAIIYDNLKITKIGKQNMQIDIILTSHWITSVSQNKLQIDCKIKRKISRVWITVFTQKRVDF